MATEMTVARNLVKKAIDAGYKISVYDGEEYPVKKSRNFTEITRALASTDQDILVIRDLDGLRIGRILLVYGNSPEELIADHTDNEAINALCELS